MLRHDGRCALGSSLVGGKANPSLGTGVGGVVSLRMAGVLRLEDHRVTLTLGEAQVDCSDEQEEIGDLKYRTLL
jgi:hypothetical protein